MLKLKISPSLLAADMGAFQKEIEKVDPFVDGMHFDVMDGQFVPNLTIGAPVMKCLKTNTPMGFDAHLMVQNPDILLKDFADAGAKHLCVHIETCPNIHRTLQVINELGMRSGVVLNPGTSYFSAYEAIKKSDYVLIMSVNPGFGGQKFLPEVLEKVRKIREDFPEKDIQIDGGIDNETVHQAVEAGANWLVSGSYIFGADDYKFAIDSLRV